MSDLQIAAAYAIFAGSYLVFAIGKFPGLKIDRPGAAIIGAVLMVSVRVISPAVALGAVDFATIVLLFSMMVIVANLRLAGFFDWITDRLAAHLDPAHVLPTVIFTAGVLSAFFVNDIVCLVMAPFVIAVTRRMQLRPVPYLLALATGSNIGSVATITGNPQNMLIGSFSRIPYRDFLAHLGPVAVAGLFIDWAVIYLFTRRHLPSANRAAIAPAIAEQLELPAGSGEYRLAFRHPSIEARKVVKPVAVTVVVIAGFLVGIPPAIVAAIGAAVLLITRTRDPRQVYDEIDWGLLVFFVGLFIIVRGAETSGLVGELLGAFHFLNLHRTAAFNVGVVVLSNLVSNVPAVMLLKSLVSQFSNQHSASLTLAMASTLAGNLTITGSVANIIVVESAHQEGGEAAHISFREYARVGVPITVLTVSLGAAWLWWIA